MIQWVFFDVGSTLADEELAYDHRIRDMIAGTALTFEEVACKRRELACLGIDGNSGIVPYFGLEKTPWHLEDEALFPYVPGMLAELRNRGLRLGVIANQAPGIVDRLRNWGILEYFGVIAASAELGISKPDPEIFRQALQTAKCVPSQAVMVGDRLDNDILPAKKLGMKTIWVRQGGAKYQSSELGKAWADAIVDSLEGIADVIDTLG